MSNYLKLFFSENAESLQKVNHHEFRNKPFSNSDVFLARVESFRLLTKGNDVKTVYELKLNTKAIPYDFLPGDTIGILPRNNDTEVDKILLRLNVDCYSEANYQLGILEGTKKKNPTIPKHIPEKGTLRDIFRYYVDIRKPPKKLFLKALVPFTGTEEAKILDRICAPTGSKEYAELITGGAQTLLGLLDTFPSCNPPIETILEHSLPLQPRYYSISSSPLKKDFLNITFFVVENNDGTKGVCTGWLEEIIKQEFGKENIPIYFRNPNNFRIPEDPSTPIIMIGTGTGIAPFIGFLEHRLMIKMHGDADMGNAYLFYGCRYRDRDYLYQKELEEFVKLEALSKLHTAFSRSSENKWYVQDEIDKNGEEFVNILHKNAAVYICGDSRTVVASVKDAVINNLVLHGHLEESLAKDYLSDLVKGNRFVADCWS